MTVPFPDADERLVLEPGCSRCPGPAAAREQIAWGHGPPDADERSSSSPASRARRNADVFVVGEAPGTGDPEAERWRGGNWTGLSFTTRHSGRRIRRLLDSAGLLESTFFTNAVKCLPPAEEVAGVDGAGATATDDGAAGADDGRDAADVLEARAPTDAERSACSGHLERELAVVDPGVVVPAGRHATASVFALGGRELDGFLETVLSVHDLDGLPPVVPILHPSYRDVWAARLGYEDGAAYELAVRERLRAVLEETLENGE